MARTPRRADVSRDLDSLAAELRFAGDRELIERVAIEVTSAVRKAGLPEEFLDYVEVGRAQKKNFAQDFSTALAQKVADSLRTRLRGILPAVDGSSTESRGRAAGGLKKLDVNYWPGPQGLGLSVSIKTLNFRDSGSQRYTKNMRRIDGELRAEASDLHRFSPYAVLAAIILLPEDAAEDARTHRSSLKHAFDVFRRRGGRSSHTDDPSTFELLFVGVYSTTADSFGRVRLFTHSADAPDSGLPADELTFSQVLRMIEAAHAVRSKE